jgi:hypothetical protein
MEFAAALIGLDGPLPREHEHAQKALAAAGRDSLLAQNLGTHFIGDRGDVMSALLLKTTTAKR